MAFNLVIFGTGSSAFSSTQMASRRSPLPLLFLFRTPFQLDAEYEAINIPGVQPLPQHQFIPQVAVELQPQDIEEGVEPQPQEDAEEGVAPQFHLMEGIEAIEGVQSQDGVIHEEPNWKFIQNFPGFLVRAFVIGLVILAFSLSFKIGRKNDHHYQGSINCIDKVVVAVNGGGQYTSISAAVNQAPNMNNKRFCIFIKSGIYREGITIEASKTNIALIRKGPNATVITSSGMLNDSATAVVRGNQFLAANLTFESSTTLAVKSSSDMAVFYNCKIVGKDITLHVDAFRHFFRDCHIYGTISGSGPAYFQSCGMYVKEDVKLKSRVLISQGDSSWMVSGFVIDQCTIGSSSGNESQTYLGCANGPYSRIVIMRSFITRINLRGWTQCNGYWPRDALYGEYNNTGPGADTTSRLHGNGVKILSPDEASKFMLQAFFSERIDWIASTGIQY